MGLNAKKMAVISAAIQAYLQDEEAVLLAAAAASAPAAVQIPSTAHNIWGLAGRQQGMQMRLMLQRRGFK